jgi:glycosyltransferase involved in cell wall biosynthesis
MPERPTLTIAVPSRNRQDCFRQTILDLIANDRDDVEFVLADNSDDPLTMADFVAGLDDPRIRFLPSPPAPLSMADNWERTLAAAGGAWVTFIGDDDYVDPDLADRIVEIEARDPGVEAIGWNRVPFQWPAARDEEKSIPVSLVNRIMRHGKDQLVRRLFGWAAATYMPQCPYGIYHGAVPRRTLEKIAASFSGRFFEHPTVDYDFLHKLVSVAETFIYINRPMSILGVAPASNSAAVGDEKRVARAVAAHRREYGEAFEKQTVAAGFPFRAESGVAGNIMAAQVWFKERYGVVHDGWQENFARAVSLECGLWKDRAGFDRHVAGLTSAFETWDGGRWRAHFAPRYLGPQPGATFWGVRDNQLYLGQAVADSQTPRAFYDILRAILPEPSDMEVLL